MHLDNYRLDDADMSGSEGDMKHLKERVQIGTDSNGKPVYKWVTGHTRQELLLNAAEILNQYNRLSTTPSAITATPMFNEYAQKWFDDIRKPMIKPQRVAEGIGVLKNYIMPYFEGKRIGDIKRHDIAAYFARPMVQELARSTAEKQGQMLNMIFRMALDDELIDKNPALDYRVYLPKRATKRKPLRIDETADIIENLNKLEDDDRLFLSILLFTGCRRGEALGMKAGDIDRVNRLVSIQRAVTFVNGRPEIGLPKTKESVRTIPIIEGFPYDLIQDMGPDDFLLGGQSPWTERKYACSMKRIKKTIDLHGATAHIFRHSFCTDAISANIDIKTVQGLLGHATPYTTMNVYAHVQREKLLSIGDRLAGIYSRDV